MVDFDFQSMSADTCGAIAQIMPVFMVALIAERIAFKRGASSAETSRRLLVALARVVVDLTLAIGLLFVTVRALVGIEVGGLEGAEARATWVLAGLLAVAVLYRWLLLSPPVSRGMQRFLPIYIDIVRAALETLTFFPEALLRVTGAFAESLFAVVSGGMASVESIASRVIERRRSRGSDRDADR
jgi:predicted Co/Zn/Cd cation transporter (cation efflux family)